MAGSTVLGLSLDAHDAVRVARFWAAALGRQLADGANAMTQSSCPATWPPPAHGWPSIKNPKARPSRTASTSTSSPPTSTVNPHG